MTGRKTGSTCSRSCDGPPDFTYHAAYTEATALLVQLDNPPHET